MTLAKHILVGTDFSDPAERAVRHAATWATILGARVTLAHVLAVPALHDGAFVQPHPEHADLEAAVHAHLDQVKERWLSDVDAKTALVRSAQPAEALVQLAESEGVDLILVATHGRSGVARFLIGSVAERVVRLAKCPVMSVPIEAEG